MRAGKIATLILSLIMAGIVGGVAAAVHLFGDLLPSFHLLTTAPRTLFAFALALALSLPLVLALIATARKALNQLRSLIELAGTDEQRPAQELLPHWLRPISHAFTGSLDRFHQREQTLRNQLRDLDIRLRLAEQHRKQIEAVLHSLRDAVLVADAYGELLMANEVAASTFGFELQSALHKPINDIVADRRLCQLILDARDHANFGERRHVEHELQTADGSRRAYDICLSCVENLKHEVGSVVAILHDQSREREISQMKSDFVSKASHELRTPLSSIRAYVEMLIDGEATDDAARAEFCRIIHGETDRLGRLIDNMLNISRIEAGIVQIDRENVDLHQTIKRAVSTIEPQARERKISINVRLTPVDLTIEGDADMIYQVMLNLLSNAVKYTPEGGRVTVAADSDNLTRSVLVSVADTGLGIPPDSMPKLFDKFYRVENYKRVAKGTGLGLSLCKHIVETLHHGQIGVESKLGMGSKFWFTVPMRYAGSSIAA